MIEINSFVRNPLAARTFVNDIGAIHQLDGSGVAGDVHPRIPRSAPQRSVIRPEHNWREYSEMKSWVMTEIRRGTTRIDDGLRYIRAN
jgi:hypothetical protein